MSVLCDWEIKSLCESLNMIPGYDPNLINPASLDVRLGKTLMVETRIRHNLVTVDISNRAKSDPYLMSPGEFLLADTQEFFNIPDYISAQFVLKSSRAREGYENLLAGWIDPGFNGSRLTLELVNARRHKPLPLYPGMKIGQIIFFKMSGIPSKSYSETGRYNCDSQVTESKG